MNHHRRAGIGAPLLLDMIRPDAIVHVAGAHHEPQPVQRLLFLLEQLRGVESQIEIRQKKNRLAGFPMRQDVANQLGGIG